MSSQIETVKTYFRRADAGSDDLLNLFTPDFEFFYPKFGIGKGSVEFHDFADGLLAVVKRLEHPIDALRFVEQGRIVVAEGTFNGELHSGETWLVGKTPAGRFCSVFEFDNGLISRMHIYVDPDYGSLNRAGFLWGEERRW